MINNLLMFSSFIEQGPKIFFKYRCVHVVIIHWQIYDSSNTFWQTLEFTGIQKYAHENTHNK